MKHSVVVALACGLAATMLQSERAGAEGIRRASRHFRHRYFVAFDETRVDVGIWTGIASETWKNRVPMEAVADELVAGTAAERLGPTFLRPPQGFQVIGPEEAVLALARDERVKWVEEVGPFLRALEARPGEYGVVLQPSALGEGRIRRIEVRRVAEELATRYGGRVTEPIWEAGPVGFGLENASEEAARAMSEDPRVEYVAENSAPEISVPTPRVDLSKRRYSVVLPIQTKEDVVEETAHTLAREYGGRIKWVLPHGFHVFVTREAAEEIRRDPRVWNVVEWPTDLEVVVPSDKFMKSPTPNPGVYTVNFVDSPRQYTNNRVRELAGQLLARHGGELMAVFTVGSPGFAMRSSEPTARAIAMDDRVKYVSEDSMMPASGASEVPRPLPPGFLPASPCRTRVTRTYAEPRWGLEVLDALLECDDRPWRAPW